MKTKEELKALKEEYEAVGKKLAELSEDEMAAVTGGSMPDIPGLGFVIARPGSKDLVQKYKEELME